MPHLQRWMSAMAERPACQRGVAIPEPFEADEVVAFAQRSLRDRVFDPRICAPIPGGAQMSQPKLIHAMVRVRELDRSLQFYDRALGLREVHRVEFPDFTLVYLRNGASEFELELTWNRGHQEPYVLGDG